MSNSLNLKVVYIKTDQRLQISKQVKNTDNLNLQLIEREAVIVLLMT